MTVDVIEAEFSDRHRAQECRAREELEVRVVELESKVKRLQTDMFKYNPFYKFEPHNPLEG